MILYVYYPFSSAAAATTTSAAASAVAGASADMEEDDPKIFFTVVVDCDSRVYWQASHVVRYLDVAKDIRRVLRSHLQYEKILRGNEIRAAKNSLYYFLTPDQARILFTKCRRQHHHRHRQFVRWFEEVCSGERLLRPKSEQDVRRYAFLSTTTAFFEPTGIAVLTVPAAAARIKSEESVSSSNLFSLPDLVESVGRRQQQQQQQQQPRAAEYQFPTTTWASPMPPSQPPPSVSPASTVDASTTNCDADESVPPPPPTATSESATSATTTAVNDDDDDENSSPQLDIVHSKSFVFHDANFNQDYKFHAIRAGWMSGPVSVGIAPFTMPDDDGCFLYVPVKKTP